MYDYVKLHNTACMMARRPVVIHAVLMSVIFEHYKQLTKLRTERRYSRFMDLGNARLDILTSVNDE